MLTKQKLETMLRQMWAAHGCNFVADKRVGISISELVRHFG